MSSAEGEVKLSRLLVLASDWARDGQIDGGTLARLIDEVDLPAALYHAALTVLDEAGLVVADDPNDSDEIHDSDGRGFNGDGLGLFMKRSRHDVLTAAQEVALGRRIERGRLARFALAENPDLSPSIVMDLESRVRDGNAGADEFARNNLRLVIHLAKRQRGYATPGLDFDDLIQEGFLGLTQAITKWDHTRGLKFSTYATWWIRQSLSRAIANKAATIRLPVHAVETLRRILKAEQRLSVDGRLVTMQSIAERVQLPVEKVRELLSWRNRVDSLNRLVATGDAELHELLADESATEPELAAERGALKEQLAAVLVSLTDREAEVVRRRFGLDGGRPETLDEIGRSKGVTRERIRQIESKAIDKLRHPKRSRRLQEFMGVGS